MSRCLYTLLSRALIILALLMIVMADPASLPIGLRLKPGPSVSVVLAQDDPIKALRDEYSKLESMGLAENFHRQLSFTMLQAYLPPGTRMTSGYRSPQKQLDLIIRMARAHGIPVSGQADLNNENSWRPPLMALRSKGFIIAAPTSTPHGTEEAVFDLSGADLNSIQNGLRQAEKAGMVKFKRILFESQNNAIHVEIDTISPKALNALSGRRSSSKGSAPSGQGAGSSMSEADQRRSMLQQLQDLHDGEPDPVKKIDYDRSRKNLLDPAIESERIKTLDEEIEQHQMEAQQLGDESPRKKTIARLSEALREHRFEDAEREAEAYASKYPNTKDAQDLLVRIRTVRLINDASDAVAEGGCSDCKKADRLINEALELTPNHQGARAVREDVDLCLESCESKPVLAIILSILFIAGAIAGALFLFKSGRGIFNRAASASGWVLEGTDGPCRGQVFPLEKKEVIIGSQGPPDGTADIVICDDERRISRRHCLIMQNGKKFYLIDESTNGVKINNQEIEKGVMAEFRMGDSISLADEAVLWLRPG